MGQVEREGCTIALRPPPGLARATRVRALSSHPQELSSALHGAEAELRPGALTEVPLAFAPMVAGRREVLVHLVDAGAPRGAAPPLAAWLVCCRAKLPLVSKRYDIRLPLGQVASPALRFPGAPLPPARERLHAPV